MDVWFCASRNPAERLNRELMKLLKLKYAPPNARTEILAPLDKDLSWKSANRTNDYQVFGWISRGSEEHLVYKC
jgi:hypothetical protein